MEAGKSPRTPPERARVRWVSGREAAAALTDPRTLRQLEPFLARECSVSQAAKETHTKPNTMLARVRRFLALGLLEVAREVPRKGRPVRLYRTVADAFFVPYEATSAESLEAAMRERDAYWEELLRANVVRARLEDAPRNGGNWGTRIYRDARGRLQVQAAVTPDENYTLLGPERPAALSSWRDSVYLDFEDAKALQRELFFLLKRYQQKRGAQRYILRVAMAPILE
ncbi:ArsR family transcriptional regulator [Truepera radiovictrix]|uniref:ArsR family transcriptional regulator n=1 Tax=Truepera radiovictrix TaxID=332249 RepID=UPI0011D0F69B|nr:ArsR family transcriptional regulator [Truepera radiovictrix]WMT58146.1 hypothetical protein RCV51_04150 [Truepera radiovictrix]